MNSDDIWELVRRLIMIVPYVFGLLMAIVWTCLPFWVRAILRQLEALNKSQTETNRLLAELAQHNSRAHHESEATRNPFQ